MRSSVGMLQSRGGSRVPLHNMRIKPRSDIVKEFDLEFRFIMEFVKSSLEYGQLALQKKLTPYFDEGDALINRFDLIMKPLRSLWASYLKKLKKSRESSYHSLPDRLSHEARRSRNR